MRDTRLLASQRQRFWGPSFVGPPNRRLDGTLHRKKKQQRKRAISVWENEGGRTEKPLL